jgi:hypothetical protein
MVSLVCGRVELVSSCIYRIYRPDARSGFERGYIAIIIDLAPLMTTELFHAMM